MMSAEDGTFNIIGCKINGTCTKVINGHSPFVFMLSRLCHRLNSASKFISTILIWTISMSHSAFNVGDLGVSSALQLTLWPARPELRELTAEAVTAFGTDEQANGLRALGHDFIQYLQFESSQT